MREADPRRRLADEQVSIWWMFAVRRRAHVPARRGDPVLPLHERDGGADGARGSRRVRRDPMAVPGRGGPAGSPERWGRSSSPGRAHLGLHRPRDQPVGAAGQPVGSRACGRRSAATREVVVAAGERPSILIVNYGDTDDATGSNTTYGWAKTTRTCSAPVCPATRRSTQTTLLRDRRGLPGRDRRPTDRARTTATRRRATGTRSRAAGDLPRTTRGVPDRGVLLGPVQRRPRG